MGFAPFGKVVSGMENVDKINPEYRENPDQGEIIQKDGNVYLRKGVSHAWITSRRPKSSHSKVFV